MRGSWLYYLAKGLEGLGLIVVENLLRRGIERQGAADPSCDVGQVADRG